MQHRPVHRPSSLRVAVTASAVALAAVGTTVVAPATAVTPTTTSAVVRTPLLAATAVPGAIDRNSRAAVLAAYKSRFVAALRVPNNWNGSTAACRVGGTSTAYRDATLTAINWARGQAGLTAVPGLNATYSSYAQRAALIMQANRSLSHNPPSSWRCWSSAGASGAGHSNIALGAAGAMSVGLYLADPGSNNTLVGHRRWLLFPRLGRIGIGNTASANAIYVLGVPLAARPAGTPSYVTWPAAGYFPRAAEPGGRWSLSSSLGYSFRSAVVHVRGPNGAAVPVTRYAPVNGYGDNTLSWRLATAPSRSVRADQSYRVTVTGIRTRSGALTTYVYTVILAS
jgi:hypothetical protein